MKKIFAAVLILALTISLCGCGAPAPKHTPEPTPTPAPTPNPAEVLYEKYAGLIDALEAEDYDGAMEQIAAMKPVPPVTEVEITMDNLWDYFEITEERTENYDAQGNVIGLVLYYYLTLKDDYELADESEYPTNIAIGYEDDYCFSMYYQPCIIDYETITTENYAYYNDIKHESRMMHFPENSRFYIIQVDNSPSEDAQIATINNFEVVNASGTLYMTST